MIFGIQQRIQAIIGEYFRGVLEEEEGVRANNRDMDVTPRETENILFHFHFPIGYISLPILDSPTLHEQPENTPCSNLRNLPQPSDCRSSRSRRRSPTIHIPKYVSHTVFGLV